MGKALAMLTSWLGLDDELDPNVPKPINREAVLRLRELSREHTFVEVRFSERIGASYQSLVLDVSPRSRSALIDEPFPASGQPIMPGEPVEIVSQSKGVPLRFESQILSLEMVEGAPAYRIALPDKVQANQRRKYYRVSIPEDMEMIARVDLDNGQSPLCKVNNLSSEGINLRINRDVTQFLKSSHVIQGLRLMLPDNDVINCDLEVRSYEYRKVPSRHTLIGGRLLSLSAPEQKKLDKLLAHYQRLTQKQQNGDS